MRITGESVQIKKIVHFCNQCLKKNIIKRHCQVELILQNYSTRKCCLCFKIYTYIDENSLTLRISKNYIFIEYHEVLFQRDKDFCTVGKCLHFYIFMPSTLSVKIKYGTKEISQMFTYMKNCAYVNVLK
jgi:hypothetical protein